MDGMQNRMRWIQKRFRLSSWDKLRTGFRAGPCCRSAGPCFALVFHYPADWLRNEQDLELIQNRIQNWTQLPLGLPTPLIRTGTQNTGSDQSRTALELDLVAAGLGCAALFRTGIRNRFRTGLRTGPSCRWAWLCCPVSHWNPELVQNRF